LKLCIKKLRPNRCRYRDMVTIDSL